MILTVHGDTLPSIKTAHYTYRALLDPNFVVIGNGKEERTFSVEAIQTMARGGAGRALEEMARGALEFLGITDEVDEDKLLIGSDLNVATVDGVKVFKSISGKFFCIVNDTKIKSRSISRLERRIKQEKGT